MYPVIFCQEEANEYTRLNFITNLKWLNIITEFFIHFSE